MIQTLQWKAIFIVVLCDALDKHGRRRPLTLAWWSMIGCTSHIIIITPGCLGPVLFGHELKNCHEWGAHVLYWNDYMTKWLMQMHSNAKTDGKVRHVGHAGRESQLLILLEPLRTDEENGEDLSYEIIVSILWWWWRIKTLRIRVIVRLKRRWRATIETWIDSCC
jgi:hypothetical protein